MKKVLNVTLLFLFISLATYSQEKPVLFGFKIAPNVGWIKPDTKGYENDGTEIGFSWGFIANFYLMENYDIVSGIDVVTQKGRLKYNELYKVDDFGFIEGELTRKYITEYLEVPLLLKMKTNDFGNKSFYGKFGISTGFLLSAKVNDKFMSPKTGQYNNEMNYYDKLKFARYSVVFGIGASFNVGGSTCILTGLTFSNGLSDILKDSNSLDPALKQKAINNYVDFHVGILF